MFGLPKDKHAVIVSPSIVVFTVALLLSLYFLYLVWTIVILLFLAFIIMTALHPAVDFFTYKLRVPRIVSISFVYLVVISGIIGLIALILPALGSQALQLVRSTNIPFLQDELRNLRLTVSEITALADQVGSSVTVAFNIINSTFSSLFTFFTLIIMAVYMTIDRPHLHKKIMWFSKKKEHVALAEQFLDTVEQQLGGWVRGQVVLMILIGVITFIGLTLLGIPYALPLALLAGFLEILPNLGPTIAAVPAVAIALITINPVMAGIVTLFYVVVQQLENNVIVPRIMQKSADVNPLIAIVVILAGWEVSGVVGALLGVPAYIVIRSIYSQFFAKR